VRVEYWAFGLRPSSPKQLHADAAEQGTSDGKVASPLSSGCGCAALSSGHLSFTEGPEIAEVAQSVKIALQGSLEINLVSPVQKN